MKRRLVISGLAGLAALVLLALAKGALDLSNSRTRQLVGELVTRAETSDSVVALTFDDGPTVPFTDSVIQTLAALDVPATFFMVGSSIERHPELAARVVEHGHELGNHTLTHPRMVLKSLGRIRREVEETDALIRRAGHAGEIYVRPPYGKRLIGLPLYLARRGRPVLLWDVEPDTYRSRAEDVIAYAEERVRPGSIILLHVEVAGRAENRRALPGLIASLRARGYRFVLLSELLARAGADP